ncbi:MAG: molybdopterin-dependent oxidoreductase [Woeseiaceae bacterium]|nr:molybdopterin-dependent oxidoreductase [Woeseiaceae bacterium]
MHLDLYSQTPRATWADNREMLKGEGQRVVDDGDFETAMSAAVRVLVRQYEVPFVSHAPLEPQNCYAHVQEHSCHIIAPTQMPSGASRSVAAIDCGLAVHPNGVEAQLEGGTIDGPSTALGLEITVSNGQVQQSSFNNYPLAKIAAIPARFEAHILPTGIRIRKLPIGRQLRV